MPFVITEACVDVNDRRCLTECPVDCIYEGARMLYIHPDECIDCGACEPLCPVQAIHHEDDLPEQLSVYSAINREFFSSVSAAAGRSWPESPATTIPRSPPSLTAGPPDRGNV